MGNQTHPAYRGPWPRIRKQILQRDNHTCQIQGPKCTGTATVVDHIIPITQGGPWWDQDNLRASCNTCNNQRVDRTRKETWRTANTHITLVVGPPGAGKTSYVQTHAEPGDLIIDYDKIAEAIGGHLKSETHRTEELHGATMTARNAILGALRKGKVENRRAWIISANPKAESVFPYHKVIVVDPGIETTMAQAVAAGRPARWIGLIEEWYRVRQGHGNGVNINSRKW